MEGRMANLPDVGLFRLIGRFVKRLGGEANVISVCAGCWFEEMNCEYMVVREMQLTLHIRDCSALPES